VLLGRLMAHDRASGVRFAVAWTENVEFVCSSIASPDWLGIFRQTRPAWRAAWFREPGPCSNLAQAPLEPADPLAAYGGHRHGRLRRQAVL
jgi:hypothetical protein